jgi:branched-chain amino acid aminotransferase
VLINYNGRLITAEEAPKLGAGSRFHFRTGLFETMLVLDGVIQLLPLHYRRLKKGVEQLSYPLPQWLNLTFLEKEILKAIEQDRQERYYRVRLQVTADENRLSFLIEALPLKEDVFALNEKGWEVQTVAISEKKFDITGNLKTINPKFYSHVTKLTKEYVCDDVLVKDGDKIVESGIGNVFWIKDKRIFTPPLSDGCIDGVMRKFLIEQLPQDFCIKEQSLSSGTLINADEVFITNAVRRIKWVTNINGHSYPSLLLPQIVEAVF